MLSGDRELVAESNDGVMMSPAMQTAPQTILSEVWTQLPKKYRKPRETAWANANFHAQQLECFLEGPSFDRQGRLYVVDIPFGRIFRISENGEWLLITEYDGWPNGLKIHSDGTIYIADYKRGLMRLDPENGKVEPYIEHWRSEGFRGLNDLIFASNGDLYFTDQGQSGLHDPTGRVFRIRHEDLNTGTLQCLLSCGPSPNGIVLNLAENQVFVAMTRDNAVWRLPLQPDGGVSKVGRFIQMSGGVGPDGLALDETGGIVVAHFGTSVCRFDSTGRATHVIQLPGALTNAVTCTNMAFGGAFNKTLYIVESSTGTILKACMPIPGRQLFSHQPIN